MSYGSQISFADFQFLYSSLSDYKSDRTLALLPYYFHKYQQD